MDASQAPWTPPNTTKEALLEKPFHIYDDAFLDIIGGNPTFTILAQTPKDPIFHEAVVWYKAKDEVFWAQNAGAPDAGTGLNKSAVLYKLALKDAEAVKNTRDARGKVNVTLVPSNPEIPNPNGMPVLPRKILSSFVFCPAVKMTDRIERRNSIQGPASDCGIWTGSQDCPGTRRAQPG